MDKIISLLNRTKLVTYRANTIFLEKEKRGENFNIFEILKLRQDETKLHTPFLAELLSPNGSHGLKELFLRAFIEKFLNNIDFDYKSASVKSEFNIGYKSEECTKGGRIDIFISDEQGNAIIIENKIYACDQQNQLLRYYNYAKDEKLNAYLFYLTLDGCLPHKKSTGNKDIAYECISYRKDILGWLDRCVELSACFPIVRETIRQYITNLKMLLNIMDTDSLNEIVKVTTSKENIEATLDIISNQWNIMTQIRKNFVLSLEKIAGRNNLMFGYDEGICFLEKECYIWFYNPKLSDKWGIYIGADKHNASNGVFYGISQLEYGKPRINKKQLAEIDSFWNEQEQTSDFPFGWAYLRGENGQGNWWNWSDIDSLKDMSNGKMGDYIENEIIKPVLSNRLLQKIDKLTKK